VHFTTSIASKSVNFYQPLQEDMDLNEAAMTSSTNKSACSSKGSSSSQSSGIIHAVTQGDLNNTQTPPDTQNGGMQLTQEPVERQNTNDIVSTQQCSVNTVDSQTRTTLGDQTSKMTIPPNPYRQPGSGRGGGIIRKVDWVNPSSSREPDQDALRALPRSSGPKNTGWDFDIKLKRGLICHNISRYDLWFKVKSTSVEEESQVASHHMLTDFFKIILLADETTILAPYLELDHNSPGINDVSSSFLVSELVSFPTLKNYFLRLYTRTLKLLQHNL
jgi:hypothetical protein